MASKESSGQKATVERVMHEYKHGELPNGRGGGKVKSRKQAIAIALSEAGESKYESPRKNKEHLRHTKAKERRGETGQDEAEGHNAATDGRQRSSRSTSSKGTSSRKGISSANATSSRSHSAHRASTSSSGEKTKAELYAQAKRRNLAGRSKMSKSELERALHH